MRNSFRFRPHHLALASDSSRRFLQPLRGVGGVRISLWRLCGLLCARHLSVPRLETSAAGNSSGGRRRHDGRESSGALPTRDAFCLAADSPVQLLSTHLVLASVSCPSSVIVLQHHPTVFVPHTRVRHPNSLCASYTRAPPFASRCRGGARPTSPCLLLPPHCVVVFETPVTV